MTAAALAIIGLPLLAAIATMPLARLIGERAAIIFSCVCVSLSAGAALWACYAVTVTGLHGTVPLFTWIESGSLSVRWAVQLDSLSTVMFVVVSLVSALVHIYSIGYMSHDRCRPRFFAYLSLFTFMMLMLTGADNFLQLFFGWEGVGLASYLLIGFWHHKPEANAAAIKAFVVNRVGDAGFILGLALIFYVFGTLDYAAVFAAAPAQTQTYFALPTGVEVHAISLIACLLLLGAMGKSAQLFLHTWLPDAMEGPTPVSALIHAATMVTAGVFLIARAHTLFELAPFALTLTIIIGAATAFFAASIALVQNDIKRVIAYSTCSQLGYMFAALGLGAPAAAIFHLFTHAFFKALLFLGAGSVIHALNDEQDMRKMGGLARRLPVSWIMMLAGVLSLTGFPLTAGYYSKDAIIETAALLHTPAGGFAFWTLLVSAGMTAFYSWRLMFMTFHGQPANGHDSAHESPLVMLIPLAVLAAGALLAGMFFYGAFLGADAESFWHGVFGHASHDGHAPLSPLVLYAPSLVMAAGFALAYALYIARPAARYALARRASLVYRFLARKWLFDELYDRIFVRPAYFLGSVFWKQGDGAIIDGLGPDGIARRIGFASRTAARLQSGYIYHYAFAMTAGALAFISWLLLRGAGG